ncbi:GNAT family N-acetyltransferase [Candidatus Chlorohelix sp.]|uniref:GNAT family N-acetyltransferase n=1 Tax=Candidatus Chlorohelix sp. TaxID=3139201 RepID=UPI00303DA835
MGQNKKLNIRLASHADADLVGELSNRSLAEIAAAGGSSQDKEAYYEACLDSDKRRNELANPHQFFLLAEVKQGPVGYAKLRANYPTVKINCQRPAELVRLYVRRELTGMGVGAALLQSLLKEAENRGFDTIWLTVWENNYGARAFYRQFGFVEAGTQVQSSGDNKQYDLLLYRSIPWRAPQQ